MRISIAGFIAFMRHIVGMAVSHRTLSNKNSTKTSDAVPAPERSAAARVASLLLANSKKRQGIVQVIDADGERLKVPHVLAEVTYQAAALLAEGRPVTVLPYEEMLSTRLRIYLVRLATLVNSQRKRLAVTGA
ncbi:MULTISPECIES: hypothetical protein [Sinorhizobium]|uniref:hypothetical protein n=1 Tax=Sinorhizobium TaxID=28105 RepID=UPI001F3717D6|nr:MULTISPECIES: hypothetical protein [Sinorhizobium]